MCRRILFASDTDDFEQRRDRLLNHALKGALNRGVRSDVELYDVLRLRDTRLSPHDPQVTVLSEDQEQQMFYKLCSSHAFVFRMPAEHRDGKEWIVQLVDQYYGLQNITGEWKDMQVTIFPRRMARGFLQQALDEGEDLKLRRNVIQELVDPDVVEDPIDDEMIQEILNRQLPHVNPDLVDKNLVQFVLDRNILQTWIGRGIFDGDTHRVDWAIDKAERFSMKLDGLREIALEYRDEIQQSQLFLVFLDVFSQGNMASHKVRRNINLMGIFAFCLNKK